MIDVERLGGKGAGNVGVWRWVFGRAVRGVWICGGRFGVVGRGYYGGVVLEVGFTVGIDGVIYLI